MKRIRVQNNIPITTWRTYYVLGEPILSLKCLTIITRDIKSLHDSVITWEKDLLKMSSFSYPIFVVKVRLVCLGFVL
jgi:hypothetical protein